MIDTQKTETDTPNCLHSKMTFGPLRVLVIGDAGPSGKTTLQVILSSALRKAGYDVSCIDTENEILTNSDWERLIGRHHQQIGLEIKSTKVEIDISTNNDYVKKIERERDTALEQLESTKRRLKVERTAAREAIDAAEADRDKAYDQFYQNPDAANNEREKAEKQNAKWQEKWTWASNAYAQSLKKIEELEAELSALKPKNE